MPFQFEIVATLVHTFFFLVSPCMHMVVSSWGPGLHSRVLSMMLSDNGEIYSLVVINSCASTMVKVLFCHGGITTQELKELYSACDFTGDVYWVEKGLL